MNNFVEFKKGVKTGLPIAIGYIPIAIAFGLLAKTAGIPAYIAILMSFLVFAGASQFISINLLAVGVSIGEIILTTFILNLRHFLMSASLSQKVDKNINKPWRALLAFGITDESFAVSSLQEERSLGKFTILGINLIGFLAWNFGTWLGLIFATGLPEKIKGCLGIALYAMFIGLLLPSMKKAKTVTLVALVAMFINTLIAYIPSLSFISSGWGIIIATVFSAALGAYLTANEVVKE